jgi:hypothetical protein
VDDVLELWISPDEQMIVVDQDEVRLQPYSTVCTSLRMPADRTRRMTFTGKTCRKRSHHSACVGSAEMRHRVPSSAGPGLKVSCTRYLAADRVPGAPLGHVCRAAAELVTLT